MTPEYSTIPDLSRQQLINAMEEFDLNMRSRPEWDGWASKKNYKFALFHNEKIYPVKTIISLATGLPVARFSGGDQANNYVQKRGLRIVSLRAHSWIIESGSVAIKVLDKSAFLHRGTGIPKEIRPFFIREEMNRGQRRQIAFVYGGQEYSARIDREKHDLGRTRLFWSAEFTGIFRQMFPHHYQEFDNDRQPGSKVILQLVRLDGYEKYGISFSGEISDETVVQDIEADELEDRGPQGEGRVREYFGKHYERNLRNRKEAIRIHGLSCKVCGFNFESTYGSRGADFIEVHHIRPISTFEDEQPVNPRTDLLTVCSNCHRMLHRKPSNVLTVEDLKDLMIEIRNLKADNPV